MSDAKRTQGGLSVKTLLIAAASSAVAAFVVPMLWRPGTVFAAAMTPIIVTLVSELLHRPVEKVTAATGRRPARGAEVLDEPFDEPFDPLAPPSADELDALPPTSEAPRAVHRRRKPLTGRQWKLGIGTGLVAFALVAALFTASELLAGDAVTGGGNRTTFFGGGSSGDTGNEQRDTPREQREKRDEQEPAPTATAEPEATATPEETATPEATATPTPTPAPVVPADPAPTP